MTTSTSPASPSVARRRLALTTAASCAIAVGLMFGVWVGQYAPVQLAVTAGCAIGTCVWAALHPLVSVERTYTYRCPEADCPAQYRVTGVALNQDLIDVVTDHSQHHR